MRHFSINPSTVFFGSTLNPGSDTFCAVACRLTLHAIVCLSSHALSSSLGVEEDETSQMCDVVTPLHFWSPSS